VSKPWPRPVDDDERVTALRELEALGQPRSAELDALARLASYVCGTPTAVVNLIDRETQWQVAAHGTEPTDASRDEAMCGYSILSQDVTYTPDASQDEVFADNPFVTGQIAEVRLYVAAPLVFRSQVVGTICAFDSRPAELSTEQIDRLRDLADTTTRLLDLRRTAGELARAAIRDPLTGLPNRSLFEEALQRAMARRGRAVTSPGVVFVDLDEFKPVNDTYGHAAGDAVLREVAHRMLGSVRATDLVARLGGDEFVVLVEESPDDHTAERALEHVAARVGAAIDGTFTLPDGTTIVLTASVGHAAAEGDDDTGEALLERADAAMYARKADRTGTSSS
jgi:diguanylate cyclase (GGDEF)-like protein